MRNALRACETRDREVPVTAAAMAERLEDQRVRVLECDEDVLLYHTGHVCCALKLDWHEGFAKSQVKVVETCATSPAAEREVWRFLFGIDLVERIQGRLDPG